MTSETKGREGLEDLARRLKETPVDENDEPAAMLEPDDAPAPASGRMSEGELDYRIRWLLEAQPTPVTKAYLEGVLSELHRARESEEAKSAGLLAASLKLDAINRKLDENLKILLAIRPDLDAAIEGVGRRDAEIAALKERAEALNSALRGCAQKLDKAEAERDGLLALIKDAPHPIECTINSCHVEPDGRWVSSGLPCNCWKARAALAEARGEGTP